eukprot:12918811-Prorocentrum_lima.AAC.1
MGGLSCSRTASRISLSLVGRVRPSQVRVSRLGNRWDDSELSIALRVVSEGHCLLAKLAPGWRSTRAS